jgi:hypothetical protein
MTETTSSNGNLEFLYATALLFKLYKAKLITREVLERAEKKCKERLRD